MRERYGDITLTMYDRVALALIDRPPHNHATVAATDRPAQSVVDVPDRTTHQAR